MQVEHYHENRTCATANFDILVSTMVGAKSRIACILQAILDFGRWNFSLTLLRTQRPFPQPHFFAQTKRHLEQTYRQLLEPEISNPSLAVRAKRAVIAEAERGNDGAEGIAKSLGMSLRGAPPGRTFSATRRRRFGNDDAKDRRR